METIERNKPASAALEALADGYLALAQITDDQGYMRPTAPVAAITEGDLLFALVTTGTDQVLAKHMAAGLAERMRGVINLCGVEAPDGTLERKQLLEEVSLAMRAAAGIATQARAAELVDLFCEAAGGHAAVIQAMGYEEAVALEMGECFMGYYLEVAEELGLQLDT